MDVSLWDVRLVFWDLINGFEKTFVFFLHISSERFSQNTNDWSSVIWYISNSVLLLVTNSISLCSIISQNIRPNFFFYFRLIIVFKTLIIFNGWRMLIWILFFRITYFLKNIGYSFILTSSIFIRNFFVGIIFLINIIILWYIFEVWRF